MAGPLDGCVPDVLGHGSNWACCSVAVLVAYNYSLTTLLQTADQQTPLAYISLVPAIALALAAMRSRPLKPEPPIYDRQVDYTIGIPLIAGRRGHQRAASGPHVGHVLGLPIDLFTLPIFVAGAVAIIFGCRVLWRQKLAIAFLFLAWPYPYQKYLLGVLNAFTNVTLIAMEKIAVWTHLAKPAGISSTTPCSRSTITGRPSPSASCRPVPGSTAWWASCWSARRSPPSSGGRSCGRCCGWPAGCCCSGRSTSLASPSSSSRARSGESPSPSTSSTRSSAWSRSAWACSS